MDTVVLHGSSLDQPISPYKSHIRKNPRKIQLSPFISKPYDNNFLPSYNYNIHSSMGLLQTPPHFLAHYSYPPYSLQPPPPLLPLPAANRRRSSSIPPANKNRNINKSKISPKKEEKKTSKIRSSDAATVSSNSPSGPDPNELPKNAAKVLPVGSKGIIGTTVLDMVPGSMVFTISPPPSSLPLPTKLISCKAEAVGIDTGATDNLRRLLRLQ